MTQTVTATAVLGPGITGSAIGLRVLNLDGTQYSAFSTSSVAETSILGTYRKAGGVICPDTGAYIIFGTATIDYAETTVDSVYGLISGSKVALDNLYDFNSASDVVAHVTLVDTTTTNTDMVDEAPSSSSVANQVWTNTIRTLSASSISASSFSTNAIDSNAFSTSAGSAVWNAEVRSLSDKVNYGLSASALNEISIKAASGVWNNSDRIITGGSAVATSGSVIAINVLDKSGYSIAASGIGLTAITASAINSDSISDNVITRIKNEIEADGTKLDHLWETTENDGGIRRFTTNALEQSPMAPSSSSVASQVRTELTTELGRIDVAISTRLAPTASGRTLDVTTTGEAGLDFTNRLDTIGILPSLAAGAIGGLPLSKDTNGRVEISGSRNTLDDLYSAIGIGSGAGTGTYTDTINDGINPLDGVRVVLSSDVAGTIPKYQAYTNASGVFTMSPDPGTYFRQLELSGYEFTQGVQVIVP